VQEQANGNSARLSELDQLRDSAFSAINAVSKAFKNTPNLSPAAQAVQALVKKHGADIPAANATAETQRLFSFVKEVEQQPLLLAAIDALQLRPSFDQMKAANIDFDQQFMQRNAEQAAAPKVDMRAIRNECDKAISALWTAIDFCQAEYGAELYAPLVSTINTFNAYYKEQLAARATRRAAAKKAKEANEEVAAEAPIALPEVR
jgi:hypothetical protein